MMKLETNDRGWTTLLQPTADDRATEFNAISGQTSDHYNGYTLMVAAYASIWVIMMVWLALLWRKQADLRGRIDGLESALSRAEAKLGKPAEDSKKSAG